MIATEDTAEILTQEGESGLETVGFSGATTLDIQKRRGRPTATTILYNSTNTILLRNVYPLPVAYWGNFITIFDGTIVAGTRLDGQGVGFTNGLGFIYRSLSTGDFGLSGNPQFKPLPPSYTYNTVGLKGSNAGVDIFFRTSMSGVDVNLSWVTSAGAVTFNAIIAAKVPQIGNLVPGVITTRRRPEGYSPGEDGVQVFFRPPCAADAVPSGFVDPSSVGVPKNAAVDAGFNTFVMNLAP